MEITHVYQKKRREFGRQCTFSDYSPRPDPNNTIEPNPDLAKEYIRRDPCDAAIQCAPEMSEHQTNTERRMTENRGMNHVEGGWPKDVNIQEVEQTIRYRKKVEKDEVYISMIQRLAGNMEHAIRQNNAIDIFQEYFDDIEEELTVDPLTAKTVNEYRDPGKTPRSVSCICWSPDGGNKLAGAYSILDFQKTDGSVKLDSLIWDIENPSKPEMHLKPSSALVTLDYSPKDAHTIAAGCYNGQVAYFDTRRGSQPVDTSAVEHSHTDAVRRVVFLSSKSGSEFFSTSTDGTVLWWDARKLNEPTERLDLIVGKTGAEKLGGTALEFESTMPTKFMVGTEQGSIITCNKKGKTPADKIAGMFYGHLGPVHTIQRNPFVPKNFLSVGDWTCRLWSEEIKEQSVWWTGKDPSFLSDACWSPTRPAVFYTVKHNGCMDVWDMTAKQGSPSLIVPIALEPLMCVRAEEQGRLLATGSKNGTITLLEVSDSLVNPQRDEKQAFNAIMERETRREKILEGRQRELKLKEKAAKAQPVDSEPAEGETEEDPLTKANSEYASTIEFERKELNKRREKRMKALATENEEAEKSMMKKLPRRTLNMMRAQERQLAALQPAAAAPVEAAGGAAEAATAATAASADTAAAPNQQPEANTGVDKIQEVSATAAQTSDTATPSGTVEGRHSPEQVSSPKPGGTTSPPAVDS